MPRENYRKTDVHAERKAAEREAFRAELARLTRNAFTRQAIRLEGKRILYVKEESK